MSDCERSIRLPEDLREYVRKNFWKRIAKTMVWETVVIVFLLCFGASWLSPLGIVFQSCVYGLLALLPILLTRILSEIMDRSWSGRVVDVKIKSYMAYTNEAKPRQYEQNVIILILENSEGKRFKKKVATHALKGPKFINDERIHAAAVNVEHYINDYSVGDEVYRFRGLSYPLVIGPNYKDRTTCVVCGQETKSDQVHCWNCGHSLIKMK